MSAFETAGVCGDSERVDALHTGLLDQEDSDTVRSHLAECAECTEQLAVLDGIRHAFDAAPAEMLLDGPPPGADLLIARAVRGVRDDVRTTRRRRFGVAVAAGFIAVAVAVVGGVVVGRTGDAGTTTEAGGFPTKEVPGTTVLRGSNTATGADMSVSVVPADGWVRLDLSASGLPAGSRCEIVVVAKDGTEIPAGGWVVSAKGAAAGSRVPGSAVVEPADVARVLLRTTDGEVLVEARA
jgi:hypothetical protein